MRRWYNLWKFWKPPEWFGGRTAEQFFVEYKSMYDYMERLLAEERKPARKKGE